MRLDLSMLRTAMENMLLRALVCEAENGGHLCEIIFIHESKYNWKNL